MKKITKRDVTFFLLGAAAMFVLSLVLNLDNNNKEFKKGYKDAKKSIEKAMD